MSQRGLIHGWSGLVRTTGFLLLAGIFCQSAAAQARQFPFALLESVFPPAAKPGASVEVKVSGTDLDDLSRIVFSHPGITAKPKMAEPGPFDKGPQPVPKEFVVTVAANVPPGWYEVRAEGKYGMSNPRTFVIDAIAQSAETEPNNSKDSSTEVALPIAASGQSNARADVDWYRFKANGGQRIIIDCYARRIDSLMEPVITVYSADGRELAISRAERDRDPLADFVTPATGDYFVRVVDALYRPTGQGADNRFQRYFYRLVIGAIPHVDFIFPAAGPAGGTRQFTVFGRNLPGGQPAGLSIDGRPLQKINASIPLPAPASNPVLNALITPEASGLDLVPYSIKAGQATSNTVPVGIARAPVTTEKEPNNASTQAQKITLPAEVQGQFYPRGDLDMYEFEAKKGDVYVLEVMSQRLGYPTDPDLVIQQVTMVTKKDAEGNETTEEQVKTLARADDSGNFGAGAAFDTRTDDPLYNFTAPADGKYRVLVRDSQSALRNDPRHVYRLAISKSQPDFRLVASPGHSLGALLLRKGGKAPVKVVAFRRDGFDADIQLKITGLPAGVTAAPAWIGSGRSTTNVMLVAAANAAPASGLIQITGTAKVGNANVTRTARFGAATWPGPPRQGNNPQLPGISRLSRNLAVSISPVEAAPVVVDIGEGNKVYETSRAGIVKIPYKNPGPFKGKITINANGLPANIDFNARKALPVNANGGTFQLNLKTNTKPGTYTFNLQGTAEKVKYSRNPEAAKAAAARKTEVDKINADAQAAAKAAAAEKATADKAAADTAALAKAATDKKTAADQVLAQAQTAAKTAVENAAKAKDAAAKTPDDANLKAASAAAAKMVADAAAKVKTATTALATAQKALDEANAKAKAAAEAKAAADKKNEEAAARAKAAAELKAKTDKRKTDTENAAKAKDANIVVYTNSVTIKVISAPVTLAATQPAGPLKQSAKLEVPVTIARLQGYNQPVTISAVLPSGVSGLSIPNATIAANQTAGKLAITAAAKATPGTHNLTVRATLKLNNQNLTVDQPITLNVQKVEPPPKK